MKIQAPTSAHIACRDDVIAAVRGHAEHLSAMEILAILSYTVGQTIAMQDQERVTPQMAMDLVMKNITAGNEDVLHNLLNSQGSA